MRDEQIPFGRDSISGYINHIDDVERGNACHCVCPSCGHSLTAKKGSIKRHHFAHQVRDIDGGQADLCEFSFYASIRAFVLQSFGLHVKVLLPSYYILLHGPDGTSRAYNFKVTDASIVQGDQFKLLEHRSSNEGHLKLEIGAHAIHVLLTHPGGPRIDLEMIEVRNGYLEVDLEALKYNYIECDFTKFDAAYVSDSVWGNLCFKRWIFHPREQYVKRIAAKHISNRLLRDRSNNKLVDEYLKKS